MRPVLEELWNGSVIPVKRCGENDPEVRELIKLIAKNEEQLSKELNRQQIERFETYTGCWEEYLYLIAAHAFGDGFSLAAKLLTSALSESH